MIEDALWPYIDLETCLPADWMDIQKEPIIYNTLTKKVYINDHWAEQDIDLRGKFLIYINPKKDRPDKNRQKWRISYEIKK